MAGDGLLHVGSQRREWSHLDLSYLVPPGCPFIRTTQKKFFLHLCSLHVFLPSLSIVSSMLLGGTVDVWWLMRSSPLRRHHPAISTRLSPRHRVAGLLCKPPFPRTPERQGEHCFLLVLYPQTQWNESSVILPPRCGPTWPHNHSLLYSFPITLFLPLRYKRRPGKSRTENSLLVSLLLQPVILLGFGFLNLDTKTLMFLFSASFMAG